MEKMFPFYGPSLFITTLANHTRPVIGVLLGKRIGEENGGRELLPRRDGDAITSRLQDEVIGNGRAMRAPIDLKASPLTIQALMNVLQEGAIQWVS